MILKYARHTMIVQQVVAFQRLDGLPHARRPRIFFRSATCFLREKIIRYRTVLGTPRLRANAVRINNSFGRLVHPDRGWNVT